MAPDVARGQGHRRAANHRVGAMHVTATTAAPADTGADTIAVGVFDDEGDRPRRRGRRAAARCSTPARRARRFRHLALHARRRAALDRSSGLGERERLRRRARAGRGRAPSRGRAARARRAHAVLGGPPPRRRRRRRRRSSRARCSSATGSTATRPSATTTTTPADLERADRLSAHHDVARRRRRAAPRVAEAQNAARDLQNRPGQRPDADARWPSARRDRRDGRRASTLHVAGREEIASRGMGALRRRRAGRRTRSPR